MNMSKDFLTKTSLSALAVSAGLALSATSADALTVTFDSSSNGTGVDLTLFNGTTTVQRLNTAVGGFTIGTIEAFASDDTSSVLSTSTIRLEGGAVGETLTVRTVHGNFSAGADPVDRSLVSFTMEGISFASALNLSGFATVDGQNTETLSFSGGSPTTIDGNTSFERDLTAPFQMATEFTIGRLDGFTSFQTRVEATVIPLPAGGLLLLSALGGVALLRGRRKTA